jgi:hypothetical protein
VTADHFRRFLSGRDAAPEYLGLAEDGLHKAVAEHGVAEVRVSRDGWFAWTADVVPTRLSVIVEGGRVTRAWWG